MRHERPSQHAPGAVRLTFIHDDGDLELVNARQLTMRAPSSDPFEEGEPEERVGSWVEIRDSDGNSLYRRRTQPVAPDTVEVYVGGEERPFRRVPRGDASHVVSVLVPDLDDARRVLLLERRPPPAEKEDEGVIEHASVTLGNLDLGRGLDGSDFADVLDDESRTQGGE